MLFATFRVTTWHNACKSLGSYFQVEARYAVMANQLEQAHVEKQELEQQLAILQQRYNRVHCDSSGVKLENPPAKRAFPEVSHEFVQQLLHPLRAPKRKSRVQAPLKGHPLTSSLVRGISVPSRGLCWM